MKVIILGACGGMGRYVAKSVSSLGQIDHLAIADLNFKDAELLASQLGSHSKGIEVAINNIENLSSISSKVISSSLFLITSSTICLLYTSKRPRD